jgi:hypothetical protein
MNEAIVSKAHGLFISILDGIPNDLLPEELKQRDPREPGRKRKLLLEHRLARTIYRRFAKQKEKVIFYLGMHYIGKAQKPPIPEDIYDDPETEAEVKRIYISSYMHSINLFEDDVLVGLDYSVFNEKASTYARKRAGELFKKIDDTTKKAIQSAISNFVETPGMTINDVVNSLPFDTKRAMRVATTEITHAYGKSNLEAGQVLKKEYPDIAVVKTWHTNADDRVCEICGPLDGMEIEIDEQFPGGFDSPEGHVNCRCFMTVRTRI